MKTPPPKLIATSLLVIVAILVSTSPAFASPSLDKQNRAQDATRTVNACAPRYKAKKGETVESIAAKCGLTTAQVIAANGGKQTIKAGKVLRFKAAPPPTVQPRVTMPSVKSPPPPPPTKAPIITREETVPTPTAPATSD